MLDTDTTRAGSPITPPGAPARALPVIDKDNEAFWTWGAKGQLAIFRCQDCKYYVHLPVRFCPKCEGVNVEPEATSGKGFITSFTINYKQWVPGLPDKLVLAIVRIAEQDDVQLITNIVNCDPDAVTMDMPVKVVFEQHEDLWIPFFEPEAK